LTADLEKLARGHRVAAPLLLSHSLLDLGARLGQQIRAGKVGCQSGVQIAKLLLVDIAAPLMTRGLQKTKSFASSRYAY